MVVKKGKRAKAAKAAKKKPLRRASPRRSGRSAEVFALSYGDAPNSLTATSKARLPVGKGELLAPDLTAVVPYVLGDDSYLLTYSSRSRHYDIYRVTKGGAGLTRTGGGTLEYGKGKHYKYSLLTPFVLGGQQYVVAYEPKGGHFDYFTLSESQAEGVADYDYAIGLQNQSQQFTELNVFNIRYNLFMLAYDTHTGKMIIFQVSVPPIGPKVYTVPYVNASATWAPGWLRFACFQWGGENFFLKTNIDEHAVNIDHVFDEPLDGTHPVGDDLPLDQTLTAVSPFSFDFSPHFLTFQKRTGAVTFNRFHSDALGWTQQASNLKAIPKSTSILTPFLVPVPAAPNQHMRPTVKNTATFVLVY